MGYEAESAVVAKVIVRGRLLKWAELKLGTYEAPTWRSGEEFSSAWYTSGFKLCCGGWAVPLYEYECRKCGRHTDKIEPVNGPHLKKCPHCGGKVESVITAPAIKFKGSGWYVTDYAGKSALGESPEKGDAGKGGKDGGEKAESSDKSEAIDKSEKKESTKDTTKESSAKGSAKESKDSRPAKKK